MFGATVFLDPPATAFLDLWAVNGEVWTFADWGSIVVLGLFQVVRFLGELRVAWGSGSFRVRGCLEFGVVVVKIVSAVGIVDGFRFVFGLWVVWGLCLFWGLGLCWV